MSDQEKDVDPDMSCEICLTCRFYHSNTPLYGECRARPPVHDAPMGFQWPSCEKNDWCGEWKGRE